MRNPALKETYFLNVVDPICGKISENRKKKNNKHINCINGSSNKYDSNSNSHTNTSNTIFTIH